MDLLFDFTAAAEARASLVGTMTRPLIVTRPGPVDVFGIRFRPGGLSQYLKLEAAEITDLVCDLTDFLGKLAGQLWEKLAEVASDERIGIAEEILCRLADGGIRVDPAIERCVLRIQQVDGCLRMNELEQGSGLSARQLERKFARHLGIPPKTFARVARFRAVLKRARLRNAPDWARIAADFGFADQAHLIRDFKALGGFTPSEYISARNSESRDVGFLQYSAEASA